MVEAVLQSDINCLFHVDCLQQLVDSLNMTNITVSNIVLNSTSSRYQTNSILLEIFSNMMLEEWNSQISYEKYFSICNVSVCTVTYVNVGNVIYIITTIIGLIGGLTKVHRFGLLLLAKIISSIKRMIYG